MNDSPLQIHLFKHGSDEFIDLLNQSNIQCKVVNPYQRLPPGTIALASSETIIEAMKVAGALSLAPAIAIAAIVVQWLKNKSARKVTITTKDGTTVQAEALNLKELEDYLSKAQKIAIIQTKSDESLAKKDESLD